MNLGFDLKDQEGEVQVSWAANQKRPIHWRPWIQAIQSVDLTTPKDVRVTLNGRNTLAIDDWIQWFETSRSVLTSGAPIIWTIHDPDLELLLRTCGLHLLGQVQHAGSGRNQDLDASAEKP